MKTWTCQKSVVVFILTSGGLLFSDCSGKAPPTAAAHIPINTGTGWSDSPFISRDGQRLYFMYSRYNFGPWIMSGGTVQPQATGPARPGLHESTTNPFDESDIYMATKNPDGTWGEAVNLGLNGAYGDSSGMEINNGNTFVWLQGNGTTNKIVMANKNPDGTWGAPIDLGSGSSGNFINYQGYTQDNPHIDPTGTLLWFTSNRPGGAGGKDIWFSHLVSGSWSAPINVNTLGGYATNTAADQDQVWVSPVSNDVYWNDSSQGLMHCVSNGTYCPTSGVGAPAVITFSGCSFAAEASMTDDGKYVYFGCGNLTTGYVTIMYAVKQANGSWGPATPVD